VVYINDLEQNVQGLISTFPDDTKTRGSADSQEDCLRIQNHIHCLKKWAEKWKNKFNPDKCEGMHFGRSNDCRNYTVNGRLLRSTETQRDLGVHVHRSLKVATQVEKVVKKAYCMLAFIGKSIEFKNRQVMLQLERALVRPHMEYCVQFLSPNYKNDVDALERVQRRYTRMSPGLGAGGVLAMKRCWRGLDCSH